MVASWPRRVVCGLSNLLSARPAIRSCSSANWGIAVGSFDERSFSVTKKPLDFASKNKGHPNASTYGLTSAGTAKLNEADWERSEWPSIQRQNVSRVSKTIFISLTRNRPVAAKQIEPYPAAILFGHQRYGGRIAHDAEISNKAAHRYLVDGQCIASWSRWKRRALLKPVISLRSAGFGSGLPSIRPRGFQFGIGRRNSRSDR
jgi:hypothetical protein